MSQEIINMEIRKNTVQCVFQSTTAVKPKESEMINFAIDLGLSPNDVHTLYQDPIKKSIYIKFNSSEICDNFASANKIGKFKYDNGIMSEITFSKISGIMKYVRIFNSPPDISDFAIQNVLENYGKIVSLRREKYGNATFPVFTGVRGVYIEIRKEIPQFLYINHFKVRTYYDGQTEKCFKCGSESHKKIDCPNNQDLTSKSNSINTDNNENNTNKICTIENSLLNEYMQTDESDTDSIINNSSEQNNENNTHTIKTQATKLKTKKLTRVSSSRVIRSQSLHGNKNSTLNLSQQKIEAIIHTQPAPKHSKIDPNVHSQPPMHLADVNDVNTSKNLLPII